MKNLEFINIQRDEIDKFRHDASNYLTLLHQEGHYIEYEDLANELIDYSDYLMNKKMCENKLVDFLLRDKKTSAEKLGIKFECNVVMPSDIPIALKDICSCFFNLIDNAIYANTTDENVNGKWISIKSNIIGNYLIIKQCNSMLVTAKKDFNGKFITSKANKSMHGKGLEIIRDIAARYNGAAEFEIKNNVFYSNVYLYMSDFSDDDMQKMTN